MNTRLTTAPVAGAQVWGSGLPANQGLLTQPLDFATALLSQGPVRAGETVWLRGGPYRRSVQRERPHPTNSTSRLQHPFEIVR